MCGADAKYDVYVVHNTLLPGGSVRFMFMFSMTYDVRTCKHTRTGHTTHTYLLSVWCLKYANGYLFVCFKLLFHFCFNKNKTNINYESNCSTCAPCSSCCRRFSGFLSHLPTLISYKISIFRWRRIYLAVRKRTMRAQSHIIGKKRRIAQLMRAYAPRTNQQKQPEHLPAH